MIDNKYYSLPQQQGKKKKGKSMAKAWQKHGKQKEK
jgi:hypothetical protein